MFKYWTLQPSTPFFWFPVNRQLSIIAYRSVYVQSGVLNPVHYFLLQMKCIYQSHYMNLFNRSLTLDDVSFLLGRRNKFCCCTYLGGERWEEWLHVWKPDPGWSLQSPFLRNVRPVWFLGAHHISHISTDFSFFISNSGDDNTLYLLRYLWTCHSHMTWGCSKILNYIIGRVSKAFEMSVP